MYHKFGYELDGAKSKSILRWYAGEDQTYTAMAKQFLVYRDGNLLILNGKITTPGVQLPIRKEVYQPILKELEEYGVVFKEQSMTYYGYKPDNTK
jgi:hypothetical protein